MILSSLLLLSACDNYLDIKPVGSVIPTTAAEYRALLARAYYVFPSERAKACFRSDEMLVNDNTYDQNSYGDQERWNDTAPSPNTVQFAWGAFYNAIFIANHVIDNQKEITDGSTDVIHQLVGEAYLMRAYLHFLLVNLHGQPYTKPGALDTKAVPLKLNNDLEATLSRNTVREVYASILSDIVAARQLMNKESWSAEFSYRFTTLAVEALQSRVSLYMGEWQSAYNAAENVLSHRSALEDLNVDSPVLPNYFESVENITALETVKSTINTAAWAPASFLSIYGDGDRRLELYFAAPDEEGKRRCIKAGKSEFSTSFRVAEMYLNVAEAAAQSDQLPQARIRLLELMQKRYTQKAYTAKAIAVNAMNKEALVEEILKERARELTFEGHRWFDLRRTTRPRIEKVIKGETYVLEQDDARYTIPIPKDAIAANPGLAN